MKRQVELDGPSTAATVLCCSCGVPMVPNQTMRCAQCLKQEVSIVDGISRQVALPHCRNCNRYNSPPWTKCEPESRELLGICLKRIKGIGKDVRLVDAAFIWTEEHSKRIRVKITVQKEVASSSVLQQTMVVEFQVVNQQCEPCQKSFTPHTWNAIVQVRQKVTHRRTFCYLEQLILKSDAHDKVVSLKETREGLDFHFAQRSHAQRFADFVSSVVPTKQKNSRHLIGHDANSNVYNYKYTIMCDLCPVCVDDVVHIPKGLHSSLSGAASLMLCHKISTVVRLIDPQTLRCYDIPAQEYWKRPPPAAVCVRAHLTEWVVLNVEEVEAPKQGTAPKHHIGGRNKSLLADIEVAKVADLGNNDERVIVRCHLGGILKAGHHVLGYDLRTVNMAGFDSSEIELTDHPDVILVRKLFQKRKGRRQWELRRMDRTKEDGDEAVNDDKDMEDFMEDMERDPELRKGVNMYKVDQPAPKGAAAASSSANAAADQDDEDDEDEELHPEVPLAELLEGLTLGDDAAP